MAGEQAEGGEDTMRKPEDFVRQHKAEVLNSGEDTSVSWCRSTRHPGRMAGEREFDERMAGGQEFGGG